MPVMQSRPLSAEYFSDVTTLQTTTMRIGAPQTEFWTITANGGNVFLRFDDDAGNTFEPDWFVLDGQTREFSGEAGDNLSVIDVASILAFPILYGIDYSTEENSMTFVTVGFL